MRRLLSSIAIPLFVVAFLAVPTQACADGAIPQRGTYPHCPSYELLADGGAAAFAANEHLQFMVTAGDLYFVWDEPSLWAPGHFLFSWWLYQESNGLAGLQRGDEVCDNTPEGYQSDTLPC